MPRVLAVAGHVRSEELTLDGLCPAIANEQTLRILRASTGARSEREYVGDAAVRLADALRAAGVEAKEHDCTYDAASYVSWAPDLVLALHYHRDPAGRAMFAVPDPDLGFHTPAAHAESVRLEQRIENGYTGATGIPLTDDLVTLNMTRLYTWCYIPEAAQALICELGNANVDTAALYDGLPKIVRFLRDAVLEHFDLAVPGPVPARRASDAPPKPVTATRDTIAAQLEGLARQVRDLP